MGKEEKILDIIDKFTDEIDDESISPKEFWEKLFEIDGLKEDMDIHIPQEYIDVINGYILDLTHKSQYGCKLDYFNEIVDEVYDEIWGWYWATITSIVIYDEESNVFVSSYEDTDSHYEEVSYERAPSWFKSGWNGLVDKTLTEEEFINYYCNLRDNNYLRFSSIRSKIKDFLCYLEEEGKLKVIANRVLTVDTDDDFFDESGFPEGSKTDGELSVVQFVDSNKILEQYTPYYEAAPIVGHFLESLDGSYLNTLLQVEEMRDF